MTNYAPLSEFAVWVSAAADYLGHYDARNVLEHLRGRLAQTVIENFAGAHDPAGNPWAPLKNPDHPPLMRTRALSRGAIEAAYQSLIHDNLLDFDESQMPFYWVFHQFGTRTIPERPFVGFSTDFLDEAEESLINDMLAKMKLN